MVVRPPFLAAAHTRSSTVRLSAKNMQDQFENKQSMKVGCCLGMLIKTKANLQVTHKTIEVPKQFSKVKGSGGKQEFQKMFVSCCKQELLPFSKTILGNEVWQSGVGFIFIHGFRKGIYSFLQAHVPCIF